MKELHGKVAVITGAASGFGREFAIRCADEGMKVILTDIDTGGLGTTVALLKPGTESLVIGSDVSSADSIEYLARSTYDRFGACHLLFNNAGVGTAGPIWTATLDDWKWTLGINVMGVVHGLRSFVPRMLAQKEESYIVNTASAAGLLAPPGSGVYAASKHAVVAITECLHHELRGQNAPIGVSVLCPAFVDTGISNSERNRPAELADSNPLGSHQTGDQIRKAIRRRHRKDHDRRGEGRALLYSDAPERENRGGNQDERYSVGSAADQYIAALTSPIFRNCSSARRCGIVRANVASWHETDMRGRPDDVCS
jgi:NAD(P)-dependent dehydrogenase (short-subunit alcohol dehydrogenase family)